MKPLITVICLCYNHSRFVRKAVDSILSQDYDNIEIIIVDDYSTDDSQEVIKDIVKQHPTIRTLLNQENKGNCRSFNSALALANGKYIVDFATDDVMVKNRISEQVAAFERLGEQYGVVYSNLLDIDENGKPINLHTEEDKKLPSGDVYYNILEKYFVSPPSMMVRKTVFDELGGYDESLIYEDFDFWVRSSRKYYYYYIDKVLCHKRILRNSHSAKFHKPGNSAAMDSTIRVCRKALWLNRSKKENKALAKRIRYEMLHAFRMQYFHQVKQYYTILKDMKAESISARLIKKAVDWNVKIFWLYSYYIRFRYPHQHS